MVAQDMHESERDDAPSVRGMKGRGDTAVDERHP